MDKGEVTLRVDAYIKNQLPLFSEKTYENGHRVYITPSGNLYPSATTIISAMSDHTSLDKWRKSIGEENANQIVKAATNRGTIMHKIIEQFFATGIVPERTEENKLGLSLFKQLQIYLDKLEPLSLELPLWSDRLKIAGRTDCIGYYDGVLSIVDFKSSKREKSEFHIRNYFMQEALYALMALEVLGIKCKQLVTLIGCEDGFPQLFRRKTDDFIQESVHLVHSYYINNNGSSAS